MLLIVLFALASSFPAHAIDVPISYESEQGPDAPRNPIVQMSINGRESQLLLDTGAGGIWFDTDFIHSLGIHGAAGKPDVDYRGHVETESLPPLTIGIGSWENKVSIARAYSMPKSLQESGIHGIVNPVRLLGNGAVIIDFPSSKLRIVDLDKRALHAWLKKSYPLFDFEEFDRLSGHLPPLDDPDQGFHSVITGNLLGHAEGPVLIDSGAGGVTFRDNYVGKIEGSTLRSPKTARLGHHEIAVGNVRVGPHRQGPDVIGSIGMRALRKLIIILPAGQSKVILGFRRRRSLD